MLDPISQIQSIYARLNEQQSNVVAPLLPTVGPVFQWKHYPKGDVVDRKHHTQYYYHSHPSHDAARLAGHGHFHIFLRGSSFLTTSEPLVISKKNQADPNKDNLAHLVAISMNDYGFPSTLFTLNHWVVQGKWYRADDMIASFENFEIEDSQYPLTTEWIAAMVQLFKPQIIALLKSRDEAIEEWQQKNPGKNVWQAKTLGVTSLCELQGAPHA